MSDAQWSSIDTAPKSFEYDITTPTGRIRGGEVIKVRGTCEGETAEFFVHWSQFDEEPPHWFIFDAEPLDWPAEEWRHLTAEEEAEVFGDDVDEAANDDEILTAALAEIATGEPAE